VGDHMGEGAAEVSTDDTGLPWRKILLLALGVTATLVAWGVLVYAAIDFGSEARSGEQTAWVLLAITTLGAAACLFVTLLLGARILPLFQHGAATAKPRTAPTTPVRPARPPGGHRAVREHESRRRSGSPSRK
jgi:RsiW-degrading membrane proteinase PrsW (M82 family)